MKTTPTSTTKPRSRRCHGFAALLTFLLGSGLAAAEGPRAQSTYSGGTCELSVVSIKRSPRMMELRLTLDGGTTGRGSMWTLRENFYLNNHGSPLVAAYAPGGKTNLAKQPHFGATAGVMVMIGNMPFDQVPSRLERVTVELDLVEITEWETLKFEAGPEPQIFHCGPFELKVAAGVNRLWVDAGAFREFAAEHKAYRARMPLEFLKPSYATTALKLVDAQGSTPSGFSSSSRNSGSPNWANEVESVDYSTWRKGPVTTPISYPITLTLKMPKRFKTEKVRFVFDQIELDPPATK